MKKAVKFLLLTIAISTQVNNLKAQLRLPLANALAADMRTIIRDYPHQFSKLQGEVIEENPQTVLYHCNFKVAGARTTSITRYSANNRKVYSWEALMLTTDNFEEAKKKFRA